MEKNEIVGKLIGYLLDAQPEYKDQAEQFPKDYENQRYLLRCLMNTWYPYKPLPSVFFELQDQLLREEAEEKHPLSADELKESGKPHLYLWQGDITRLKVDAIVNAANVGCAKLIPLYILGVSEESRNSATLRRFSSSGTAA